MKHRKTAPTSQRSSSGGNRLWKFCRWGLGVCLIVIGALVIMADIPGGLMLLLLALLLLPPTAARITLHVPLLQHRWVTVAAYLAVVWVTLLALGDGQGLSSAAKFVALLGSVALFCGCIQPLWVRFCFSKLPTRRQVGTWFGSITVVALLLSFVHPGASSTIGFSLDITIDDMAASMTEETPDALFATGPFYFGSAPSYEPYTKTLEGHRREQVRRIIADADKALRSLERTHVQADTVRGAFVQTMEIAIESATDPALKKALATKFYEGLETSITSVTLLSSAQALEQVLRGTEGEMFDPAKTAANFQRVLMVWRATDALQQEFVTHTATLAGISNVYGASSNATEQEIAAMIEGVVPVEVDAFGEAFAAHIRVLADVDRGLGQLHEGDMVYLTQVVAFLDEQIPIAKETLQSPLVTERLGAQDVQSVKSYVHALDAWSSLIRMRLEKEGRSVALVAPGSAGGAMTVHALSLGDAAWTVYDAVGTTANTVGSYTWAGIKNTGKLARYGLQATGDALVVAADTIKQTVNGESDTYNPLFHFASNIDKAHERYMNGKLGYQALEGAKNFFNYVEDTVEEKIDTTLGRMPGDVVRWAIGDGNISGGVDYIMNVPGKVAKLGVSMFTGLGKGIAMVGSPESSAGDIAMGAAEIGLSFVGGSQNILKGSDLVQTFRGSGLLSKLKSYLPKWGAPKVAAEVTDDALRAAYQEGAEKLVTVNWKRAWDNFAEIMSTKTPWKTMRENAAQVVKDSGIGLWESKPILEHLATFFDRKNLLQSLKGVLGGKSYWKALEDNVISRTEYIDNFAGSYVDDVAKEWLKSAVDYLGDTPTEGWRGPMLTSEDFIQMAEELQLDNPMERFLLLNPTKEDMMQLLFGALLGVESQPRREVPTPPPARKPIQQPKPSTPAPATPPVPKPATPEPSTAQENMKRDCRSQGGTWTSVGTCFIPEEELEPVPVEPEPEPAPPPPPPPPPMGSHGQTVTDCNACWNAGLDCVCGYDSCRCCNGWCD